MNDETTSNFQSVDNVMTALTVGGMAVACAVMVAVSGIQAVVA